VESVLPAGSVARTLNVWRPSSSASVVCGEVHAAKLAVSVRHSKVEPVSVEENANVGVELLISRCGPDVIVVVGAAVSTVKVRRSGVRSVLPAASMARTSNVWLPSLSVAVVFGEVQAA
jgi:nucleoside phosphorylase